MEEVLVPLALFVCIGYSIVGVTRAIADARTRRKLVESGATADVVRAVAGPPPPGREPYPSLLWGLVTAAVGLALVLVQVLRLDPEKPAGAGLVLLLGAAGLLVYHATSRRLARSDTVRGLAAGRPGEAAALPPATPAAARLGVGEPA